MTPGVQQNSVSNTVQNVVQNSTEALSTSQSVVRYKFPGNLIGVVREEDWDNMEIKQQIALIISLGENPQNYLESNIVNASQNIQTENIQNIQSNSQLHQEELKVVEKPVEIPALQPVKPVIAEVPVNNFMPAIEATKNEFIAVKKEVSTIEQDFISGKTVEASKNNAEQNQTKDKQLSQEDKTRIIEETGLNLWMPKLFGYKPSATTIKKATTNKSDDPADYQISNAESWLRLLIGKLFKRNMSANEI